MRSCLHSVPHSRRRRRRPPPRASPSPPPHAPPVPRAAAPELRRHRAQPPQSTGSGSVSVHVCSGNLYRFRLYLLRLLIFFMKLICLSVSYYILCTFWEYMNAYLLNLMAKISKTCIFLSVHLSCHFFFLAREPGRAGPIQRLTQAEPNFLAR
jgi:hypothetical protein